MSPPICDTVLLRSIHGQHSFQPNFSTRLHDFILERLKADVRCQRKLQQRGGKEGNSVKVGFGSGGKGTQRTPNMT